MSEVIVIANQKGGVGKTMTSVSLSACLALNNKKVIARILSPALTTSAATQSAIFTSAFFMPLAFSF